MKIKDRKKIQNLYAIKNINHFIKLLEKRFYPDFDPLYIKEIKKISEAFNIRLTREQKLKFCKKCNTYWNIETREIRLNPNTNTKDYICKKCSFTRRFRYK